MLWAEPFVKQEGILPKEGAWRDQRAAKFLEGGQLSATVGAAGTGPGKAVPKPAAGTPEAGSDPKTVRGHEPRVYTPANSRGTGSGEILARRNEGNTRAAPGRTVTEAGNAIRIYFAFAAEANRIAAARKVDAQPRPAQENHNPLKHRSSAFLNRFTWLAEAPMRTERRHCWSASIGDRRVRR